jgi:transcriptional regulator with XRE-family HTH domain
LFHSEHFAYFVAMDTVKNITELIKYERKKRGLSQEGLALKSEIGRAYMSTVENGQRNISIQMLHQIITQGLEMSLSEFFIKYDQTYPPNK